MATAAAAALAALFCQQVDLIDTLKKCLLAQHLCAVSKFCILLAKYADPIITSSQCGLYNSVDLKPQNVLRLSFYPFK